MVNRASDAREQAGGDRRLGVAFRVDAALSLAAGALWVFAPLYFVRSTFGVAAPDAVHALLAAKGGLPLLLLGGAYYLRLVGAVGLREPAFRLWQQALVPVDLGMLGLGVHMLTTANGAEPRAAAAGQVTVAALRLALRFVYFRALAAGAASRSSGG